MASKSIQGSGEIRQHVDQLENHQLTLKKDIKTAEEKLQVTSMRFRNLTGEMKEKGEKCKKEMDVIISEYVKLCENLEKESEDLLTNHITDLEDRYGRSVELVLDCNQALKSGQDIQLSSEQLYTPSAMPHLPTLQFDPCLDSNDHLKQAIGKLSTSTDKNTISTDKGSRQAKPKVGFSAAKSMVTKEVSLPSPNQLLDTPRILSEFKCPGRVSSICPSPRGQAWTRHAQTLTLLDKTGKVKHKVECSDCITDISLAPNSHKLWLCTWGRKILTCDPGSLQEVFTTDSVPWCLCVTNTDHVIVGMKHKISMFTSQGLMVCTTSTKESGIVRPERISQCSVTGNIALVDTDNKSNSLILDNSLKVLHNHIGGGAIASSIRPVDLVYDCHGNLVLADSENKSLELLTGTGEYIQTIQVMSGPIKAIGTDTGNVLWVAVFNKQRDSYQIQLLQYYNTSKYT